MLTCTWRGEPIADIHAWCRSRGEQLVKFRARRRVLSPMTGHVEEEHFEGELPASFFDNLQMTNGWFYWEVSRYTPEEGAR